MKALHSGYRIVWTAALLAASPLLAGADGGGCNTGGKIDVGSGAPGDDAGSSCTQADCAGQGATAEAKICSDGSSLGRSVCARSSSTGKCAWDFPACPPLDASTPCMCAGPAPGAPNGVCPDGSISGPVCVVNPGLPPLPGMPAPAVTCSWTLRSCPVDAAACPQYGCSPQCPNGVIKDQNGCDTCACVPAADSGSGSVDASTGACTKANCAGLAAPALAKLCSDGSTVTASLCGRSPVTMKCDWEFPACPAVDAATCVCAGPAPSAPNGACPDGSVFGPVCEAVNPAAPLPMGSPAPSVACSWTIRSCPVDAGSCAAIEQKAMDVVAAAFDPTSGTTCTIDSDCEVVAFASDCFDACTRFVNKAGATAIQSAITAVNTNVCPGFKSAGCIVPLPPCAAFGPPHCVAGRCQ
jgi:Antistasin family